MATKTKSNLLRSALFALPVVLALNLPVFAYTDNDLTSAVDETYQIIQTEEGTDKLQSYADIVYNEIIEGYKSNLLKKSTFNRSLTLLSMLNDKGYVSNDKMKSLDALDRSRMILENENYGHPKTIDDRFGENAQDFRNISNDLDSVFMKTIPDGKARMIKLFNSLSENGLGGLEHKLMKSFSELNKDIFNYNWKDLSKMLQAAGVTKDSLTSLLNTSKVNTYRGDQILGTHLSSYNMADPNFIYPFHGDSVIDSGYGWRQDPFTKKPDFHPGIDITPDAYNMGNATRDDLSILSIGPSGKVVTVGNEWPKGKYVVVTYNTPKGSYKAYYDHLKSYGKNIKEGATIPQGEVIGQIGMTGRATGPHLHLSLYKNGELIDPITR